MQRNLERDYEILKGELKMKIFIIERLKKDPDEVPPN